MLYAEAQPRAVGGDCGQHWAHAEGILKTSSLYLAIPLPKKHTSFRRGSTSASTTGEPSTGMNNNSISVMFNHECHRTLLSHGRRRGIGGSGTVGKKQTVVRRVPEHMKTIGSYFVCHPSRTNSSTPSSSTTSWKTRVPASPTRSIRWTSAFRDDSNSLTPPKSSV